MSVFISILNVIAAIPKIGEEFEKIVALVVGWYVNRQQGDTLKMIADAAALGARAQTQAERQEAANAWQKALSRPRYS